MRVAIFTILVVAFIGCSKALAGTELHAYGAYTNSANSEVYFDYDLLNYKRGLFLGICPTTRQLQWSYWFRLEGAGPEYNFRQMTVQDGIASVGTSRVYLSVVAGKVVIDHDGTAMTIDIQVEQAGVTNQFVGNGTYTIQQPK
jgi:hypothetical protein